MNNKHNLSPAHLEQLSREHGRLCVGTAQDAIAGATAAAGKALLTGGAILPAAAEAGAVGGLRCLGHADAAQELLKQADISRMCEDPNDMMQRLEATATYNSVFDS